MEKRLTRRATKRANAHIGNGERSTGALHRAQARSVGLQRASAGSDTGLHARRGRDCGRSGGAGGAGAGGGGGKVGRARATSQSATGQALAGAVDGAGLELSVGLGGGGVDGEDHAVAAVVSLGAVHPCG